jgi:hypothetical protein
LALACELSALYLLDNVEKYNGDITTLTHPVIVRIFRKIEEDLPTEFIFDKVIEIITTFKVKLDEFQKSDEFVNRGSVSEKGVVDVEAEFVADFSDNFPFEFDRKKISSAAVSKHDNSLEVLQYVMRSCNCPWPDDIYDKALKYGRLDILLWAVSNGCPWSPNPNDILFTVACSRVATATPDILNWIADQNFVFEDAEDCIHCAVVMKNFNFIRWAKSNLLPNFWHDSIIKKAAAAGNLPALIWAAEIHPESFTSALLGILVQNATSRGHMNVLNWILEKYGIFKTAFLNRRLCDIAAEKGFVEILQWAVANGCEWDRSHCCGLAILHQRLKVLIWIKFKADVYSHYTSPYWYGESVWCGKNVLFRLIELIREEGDFRQWLILNIGSEEGVYFDETRACWRTIDNDETNKSFLEKDK